jgi:hypothetical protein
MSMCTGLYEVGEMSLEVSHQLDVPTLHTIGMPRRPKLLIHPRMAMPWR